MASAGGGAPALVNMEDNQEYTTEQRSDEDVVKIDAKMNQGKRVDYALQETPVESINQYLFALSSHMTYWQSKDTILLILNHIYRDRNSNDIFE